MDLTVAVLESWERQCRIVEAVATRITDSNRNLKPSPDGFSLDAHLAHMHSTRQYFLSQIAPRHAANLGRSYADEQGTPLADLEAIKRLLTESGIAVRNAVAEGLAKGGPMTGQNVTYDSPILFLDHMIWHDGWHVGLIFLALRLAGQEPPEEWEETQVWGQWRKESY